MSDNDFMFGEKVHAFATFPITQQGLGFFAFAAGLIVTIGSIAQRIFHACQKKLFQSQLASEEKKSNADSKKIDELKQKITRQNGKIRGDNNRIGTGIFLLIGLGLLTFTPVVGSIVNGVIWYREVQNKKALSSDPVYS
jgi:hypothetical protein